MSTAFYSPLVSADLIWEATRSQNAYLVKRAGVQLSRDPLNVANVHSRKHAGYVNEKAVGVLAAEKGVTLLTKKKSAAQHPNAVVKANLGGSSRKTYKAIANTVARNGYRADLRAAAVARASAIRQSQRPVREAPAPKARGKKAQKAAAAEEEN